MTKRPSFETTRGFLTWLLTLRQRKPHVCGFQDCFSFSHFFGYFLPLLKRKTKFFKYWTKFGIKEAKVLPSRCSSLLPRRKPVQQNWQRFFKIFWKIVRALSVNEIKVTSRNGFIDNIFALESKIELNNDKATLFWDYPWILDMAINF